MVKISIPIDILIVSIKMASILSPLDPYFKAVNSPRDERLHLILAAFHTHATLTDPDGNTYYGRDEIKNFYSSARSSVFTTGFKATPDPDSAQNTRPNEIRVDITLSNDVGQIVVRDWFEMKDGLIVTMRITKLAQ